MMNKRAMTVGGLVCLILIVLFSDGYGHGYFYSGNDLYALYLRHKAGETELAVGLFRGYCFAVADCLDGVSFSLPPGEGGVKGEQIADICGKYLENHPETRHLSAAVLCGRALMEAFPIKK